MKKAYLSLLVLMLMVAKVGAQDFIADSIRSVIAKTKSDSVKASALIDLATYKLNVLKKYDTAFIILKNTLVFARQKGLAMHEVEALGALSDYYDYRNPDKGYQFKLQAISLARRHGLKQLETDLLLKLSNNLDNKPDSVKLLIEQALSIALQNNLVEQQISTLSRKGNFYAAAYIDSAKSCFLQGLALARQSHLPKSEVGLLQTMANTYSDFNWGDSANHFMQEAVSVARENHLADLELSLLANLIGSNSSFFLKDSLITYYERMLYLSRQLHRDSLSIMAQFAPASVNIGNYPKALQTLLTVLHGYEVTKDSSKIDEALFQVGNLYQSAKDFKKSNEYFYQALKYGRANEYVYFSLPRFIALSYLRLKQNDSARYYADKAYQMALNFYHEPDNIPGFILNDLGRVYLEIGKDSLALACLQRSYFYFTHGHYDADNYAETTVGLAEYFKKAGMADSSLYYAKLAFNTGQNNGFLDYLTESGNLIADYYHSKHNSDSTYRYQQIAFESYKALYGDESIRQIQYMSFAEQQRERDVALAKKMAADQNRSNLRLYALITILIVGAAIGAIVFRNNMHRQKAFELLKKQKQEIDLQKSKVEASLRELKATQSQLIQSEKMASLGELTAGIAHEIQNPLNFVNNFSEVSNELMSEMVEEVHKGNTDEVKAIANDIKQNLEKINHHGKRADAIVKGMLQHSRLGTGKKEPTDINKLADEYLRLAYHGLKGKDNSFNTTMQTDFDESIGKINIIPQDIGRVLLNLYYNAFYAVTEKKKQQPDNYEPTISLSTKKIDSKISITVKDNGNGIPQKIVDKIFQPFFTTKPTGQGTGLGLSLSYDIVKVHGGEIKVNTKEGELTEFVIQLPTST